MLKTLQYGTHIHIKIGPVGEEGDVQLEAVVGPGAELEHAELLVKGKEERVEGTRASQDGLGHPQEISAVAGYHQSIPLLL